MIIQPTVNYVPAFPIIRGEASPIVVLCDPPSLRAVQQGLPIDHDTLTYFGKILKEYGFKKGDMALVQLCPPMPEAILKSASKKWAHVEPGISAVHAAIKALNPRIVVSFGELASRVVLGRAVAITKARGVVVNSDSLGLPVLPSLSPSFVRRIPDNLPAFRADINTLAMLKDADFNTTNVQRLATDYRWVFDLDPLKNEIGQHLAVDTETTGLVWHDEQTRVLTVQMSPRPGVSWVCPIDQEYCEKWFPNFPTAARLRLVEQLRVIMANGRIRKMAHNLKFDHAMLRKSGLPVKGWVHDTQLLAFNIDENMLRKDLNECVRIWVPAMAGYADVFDQTTDKSRMIDVPPDKMLPYAGGDTDAVFRLARVLDVELRKDQRQRNIYKRIQMPAMLVFANSVERYGQLIDRGKLNEMQGELETYVKAQYRRLIRMVPASVRRRHLTKGLKFSRHDFIRDILFSTDGFALKPVMFTDSTKDLKDQSQKIPATGKDHLTYFVSDPRPQVADFCLQMILYGAAEKMLSTYVGDEEEGSGFHKYIAANGRIYPSYMLHRTNTGRSASANPNGQNFPKRSHPSGPNWAKQYQGIFLATPGYTLVNVDLSQIELRLVAWMANERRMLEIYRDRGDIHTGTARDVVLRITPEQWLRQEAATIKLNRFRAKAVNFGLIYGMSAAGFQVYAKTDYNIDLTLEQAEALRYRFFETYPDLIPWHRTMKDFAHRHGFVRSLHGACRHLPSIFSNDRSIVAQAERQAINAPIQRMGSDLGVAGMIRFAAQADPEYFRLIGFVHDALVLECKNGYADEGAANLKWVMESLDYKSWFGITPPLPILADAEVGDPDGSASTLKERPDIEAIKPDWWSDDEERAIHMFLVN